MSAIVIVDTSVFLNILNVPGMNNDWEDVYKELERLIEAEDHLFIPMAAIVETGNHIAQLANGAQRRSVAKRFVDNVRQALNDEAPWKPINFPTNNEVLGWLDCFTEAATHGMGVGDLSIKKEWETLCERHSMSRVRVWTLDADLGGLDRIPH
ncbi:hypothetical protein [Delftia sp. RIT313]|uniref:hypothetical protein n=1 Tax=Delftia sp. RIT313 TaxID=1468410 RepID=UPI0009DFA702|nr:hypothetical protein [Delftia sp. RIT313]